MNKQIEIVQYIKRLQSLILKGKKSAELVTQVYAENYNGENLSDERRHLFSRLFAVMLNHRTLYDVMNGVFLELNLIYTMEPVFNKLTLPASPLIAGVPEAWLESLDGVMKTLAYMLEHHPSVDALKDLKIISIHRRAMQLMSEVGCLVAKSLLVENFVICSHVQEYIVDKEDFTFFFKAPKDGCEWLDKILNEQAEEEIPSRLH